MTAKLLHFQLRPWTPCRFAADVRQALIGFSYQFPVLVEFFEDHNADQSARLAPTSDCGNNWLIMTADSRGVAVLSADATPIGVFRTGPELRAALLPVIAALASRRQQPAAIRETAERRAEGAGDQSRAQTGTGQPLAFVRVAERLGAFTMDQAPCAAAPFPIEEQSMTAMSLTANRFHGTEHREHDLCPSFQPSRPGPAPVGQR